MRIYHVAAWDMRGNRLHTIAIPFPDETFYVSAEYFGYTTPTGEAFPPLTEERNMGYRVSETFASNYLRAETFTKDGRDYSIKGVDMDKVGNDVKLVLSFESCDDLLPLNKTNALTLAEAFGDDTDKWIGESINIYRDVTMYQGKRTPCLRVRSARSSVE